MRSIKKSQAHCNLASLKNSINNKHFFDTTKISEVSG